MATKSKKASTKKTPKTNIKPKTIGILAGLAVAFCALDEIFAIVWWNEIDWLETCILIGIALFSIALYAAFKKKSQRSSDVLATAVIVLALIFHIVYLSSSLPFLLPIFGVVALPSVSIVIDIIILIALIVFVCAYFVGMNKSNKKAITLGCSLNAIIAAAAVCAMLTTVTTMVNLPAVEDIDGTQVTEVFDELDIEIDESLPEFGTEEAESMMQTARFAMLGESLSYYALIIVAVSLVQKSRKA